MSTTSIFPITTSGKAFIDNNNNRFVVRGVALSSNEATADLLSDDYYDYFNDYILPQLTYLNVNLVRVYWVKETASHKRVMNLLEQNNIGVMVGMMSNSTSIDRNKPVYSSALEQRMYTIATEFCGYNNTICFSVGNEVVFPGEIYNNFNSALEANQTILTDALVLKLLIKTLKAYMSANQLRAVPVGMAMQDGDTSTLSAWSGIGTDLIAQFYACGDATERADYIGINTYAYLPGGPMNAYDRLANEVNGTYLQVEQNINIAIPVFLTETGGIPTPPVKRDWAIVGQMYSEALLYNNLSGQIAFQFFNKKENLGLYTENPLATSGKITKPVVPFSHTEYGGAGNLSQQFGSYVSTTVNLPNPNPTSSAFPPSLAMGSTNFDTLLAHITIENFAKCEIAVVQNLTTVAKVPASNGISPVVQKIYVISNLDIKLQSWDVWDEVCLVPASSIQDGLVVQNNVKWGGSCALSTQ